MKNTKKRFPAALALSLLMLTGPGRPAAANNELWLFEDAGVKTKDELLLFWDEKDLYVETATRSKKPLSQAAESITVVTARQIEDMGAHNLAEVLNRVPGLFVASHGQDFGTPALLHMQGSEERHVLLVLDGVPMNTLSDNNALTFNIPIGIIERLEIVRGPGSSTWGSSLGGVINVVTKQAGLSSRPSGTVRGSYGQDASHDLRTEFTGLFGGLAYYLFSDNQHSDGLLNDREYDTGDLYAKLQTELNARTTAGVTLSFANPRYATGPFPSFDFESDISSRDFLVTGFLKTHLSAGLDFDLNLFGHQQEFNSRTASLGAGTFLWTTPAGGLVESATFDEKESGASARLTGRWGRHLAVLGFDGSQGRLAHTTTAGLDYRTIFGLPAMSINRPELDKWAVYANDTIGLGSFSLVPGLRYDTNTATGSFTSPSLGLTYQAGSRTVLRATASRGFSFPGLSPIETGGLFIKANPDLENEEVKSYQLGVESSLCDYVWTRLALFYHDADKALVKTASTTPPLSIFTNDNEVLRRGVELELETAPYHGFSFGSGVSYVHKEYRSADPAVAPVFYRELMGNLRFTYDDQERLAQLLGHFVRWEDPHFVEEGSSMDGHLTWVWDLNLRHKLLSTETTRTDLFVTAHNIFNGRQYLREDSRNPWQWVEAGVKITF